jgi:hypothetical protein
MLQKERKTASTLLHLIDLINNNKVKQKEKERERGEGVNRDLTCDFS